MAVLGSNSLNHSADLLVQRAGTTRITVTSTGLTLGGNVILGNAGTATNHAVRADRTISTGSGLSGGGNLTANRTFSVDSTVLRTSGQQQITKNAHASGASDYHLELFSPNINGANEVSLRMHQANQWFGQIRLRSDGFHFTQGGDNSYRNIFFGTATGALSGNATTATTATNCSRQILNGNGMNFTGGELNTNRTITLGTPGTLTGTTTNSVTTSSHTHAITVNLGVTAGTTAGPTITSSAGTNAVIPTASATASGAVTTGNQTWAGTKTFNATISGSISGNAATATTATNCSRQILNGNGMNFTGGELNTNRTITLGTPSTCTGATTNSVTTSSHTHVIQVNLGVTAGTTNGPTITSSAGTNAVIPTASNTASGAVTTGNQTWAGIKIFSGEIRALQDIGDGTIATRIRFGRDATQYTSFYGNASGNRMLSVSTSTNPKDFQFRVTDTVNTGTFVFSRTGVLSAAGFSGSGASLTALNGSNITTGSVADARIPSTLVRTSRSISTGSGIDGGGDLTANRTFSVDSTVIRTTGNQTIDGTKTFTARPTANKYLSSITGSVSADGFIHASNSQLGMTGDVNGRVMRLYGLNASNTRVEFAFLRNDGTGGCSLPGSGASTTSSAANCRISSGGFIQRSTSSAIYKKDIEPAILEISENIIYNSEPVWYRSTCKSDNCDWSWWGFIAEQIADVDPRMVGWDYRLSDLYVNDEGRTVPKEGAEKQPEGVNYDRYVVHLVNVAQKQKELIDNLIERISDLENLIK